MEDKYENWEIPIPLPDMEAELTRMRQVCCSPSLQMPKKACGQ